jgi:hypothetical protein
MNLLPPSFWRQLTKKNTCSFNQQGSPIDIPCSPTQENTSRGMTPDSAKQDSQ